jgi:hypothetical protein
MDWRTTPLVICEQSDEQCHVCRHWAIHGTFDECTGEQTYCSIAGTMVRCVGTYNSSGTER